MAIPHIVIKGVQMLASSKNGRKVIGGIVVAPIAVVAIAIMAFTALISGIFALVFGAITDTAVEQSWNDIKKNVQSALIGVNNEINTDIKDKTYEFMPDFSINLSKSVLQKTFSEGNSSFLLLYDTKEVDESVKITKNVINLLKKADTQQKLDVITKDTEFAELKLADLKKDTRFYEDKDFDTSKYAETTNNLIYCLVKRQLASYEYVYDEFEVDGKPAKSQTLTVIKNGKTDIVEYICYGEGDIYLPRFMAMYQGEVYQEFERLAEEKTSELEEEMQEAIGTLESGDENNGVTANDFKVAILDIFQAQEIGQIFQKAVADGKIGASYEMTEEENTKKLTITLVTPSEEEWLQLFEVEPETEKYVDECQTVIEKVLKDAEITDLYLSVDGTIQGALFTYFQGFFNLPVESTDLKENTNGILTTLNDRVKIHENGQTPIGKAYESGVTLYLNSADVPVKFGLLPYTENVIEDVIICDVYDANSYSHRVVKDQASYTYNCCAVQLAFYINTDEFENVYGFEFPDIYSTTGEKIESEGTLTMVVEYNCLDRLNKIEEIDIGSSIYDIVKEGDEMIIGYAHNGKHDKEKDENPELLTWRHAFDSEEIPHLNIKTSFIDGELVVPEYSEAKVYNGLSAHFIGAKVNPLLWFKAFRTDVNEEILDTLLPII